MEGKSNNSVRALKAHLALNVREVEKSNCCYALQEKTWIQDPDGNEWEAFVVLEDNMANSGLCCVTEAPQPIAIGR